MVIFWIAVTLAVGTMVYLMWDEMQFGFQQSAPFKIGGGLFLFLAFYYGAVSLLVSCWRFIVIGWILTQ